MGVCPFGGRSAYSVRVNKTAIQALVRGGKTLDRFTPLIERTRALVAHCDPARLAQTDLVVFYEDGTVPAGLHAEIEERSGAPLLFVPIYPFLPAPSVVLHEASGGWPWGYRHMCQFQYSTFWHYTEQYDVLLRVDDDVLVRSDVLTALTAPLDGRVLASYGAWFPDVEYVCVGMNDFFNERCQVQRFAPPCRGCPDPVHCQCSGYSGPDVVVWARDLAGLRQVPAVRRLADEVLANGGCLSRRWGDLPLWGETLLRELPGRHVKVPGVSYVHGSWNDFEVSS